MTVSLPHPCTTMLPTMLTMRSAPSIPSGILRSTFFWAMTGDEANAIVAAPMMQARLSVAHPRAQSRAARASASTRHLRRPAHQIHLLSIRSRQHFDQHLVRRVSRERASSFENRLVYRAETRLQLCDCFRGQ